jgi:outer membrane biosynthesis protein TonB
MLLLERILTPINALLPDISRVPKRRQAVGAIVASLVLHLVLLLLFVAIAAILPDAGIRLAEANPEPAALEVQIVASPEEELVTPEELKAAAERPVIDSTGLAQTTEAPKNALFESDTNLKAGSEAPPTGDLPMPSQEGRTDLQSPQFKNQDAVLGRGKASESLASLTPRPQPTKSSPAQNKPEAAPAPQKTEASKTPEVTEVKPDQLAIEQKIKPRVTAPDVALRPLPNAEENTQMAKLTTPKPKRAPAFQEQQMATRVDGSIDTRGPKGIDADRTPRGVYIKKVRAQIASRFFYYAGKRADLYAYGTATIRFTISKDGSVTGVRIIQNTSNEAYGLMCQQSVLEAEIPPLPQEVLPLTSNGKLEMTWTLNNVPPL